MVNKRYPELRYYCPYANVWFKDKSFCEKDFRFKEHDGGSCRYFAGTEEGYGKPLQMITILCNYPPRGDY